jgi:hypothetical protein
VIKPEPLRIAILNNFSSSMTISRARVKEGNDLVEWAQQTGLVEPPIDNGDGTVVLSVFGDTLVSDSEKTFTRLWVQVDSLN